jgi:hypothetical protein
MHAEHEISYNNTHKRHKLHALKLKPTNDILSVWTNVSIIQQLSV